MQLAPVIAPEIFELRPDFAALCLLVEGAGNRASDAASEGFLTAAIADLDGSPWAEAHLQAWRETYRAFGAKPKRTPCSVEALRKRALRDGRIRPANAVVDLYNAISLRYAVPVGGEDADRYSGQPTLRQASGHEPFETLSEGKPKTEFPEPGEVIWSDDAGVTCRRWNWRQCKRTQIGEDTRTMWFVLERLEPMPMEALAIAGAELERGLGLLAASPRISVKLFHRDHPDGQDVVLPTQGASG